MEFGSTFEASAKKEATQLSKQPSVEAIVSDSSDDEAFLQMAITPMTASVASTSYPSSRTQTLARPQRKRRYIPTPEQTRSCKVTQADAVDCVEDDVELLGASPLPKSSKSARGKHVPVEDIIVSDDEEVLFRPPPSVSKLPYEAQGPVPAQTPTSSSTGSSLLSRLQMSLHSLPPTVVVKGKVHDSAKKLKKIKRGGLAEQCQKLAAYQRSEQNLYHHTRERAPARDRALCLEAGIASRDGGLVSVSCRVLAGHPDRKLVVIFAVNTDVSSLRPGTCFQIDAPWRELSMEAGPKVVLGPLFWHVRQAPNSQEQNDAAVELVCLLDGEDDSLDGLLSPSSHGKRLLTTIVGTRPSPHKQPAPGRVSPDPTMPKMQLFQ